MREGIITRPTLGTARGERNGSEGVPTPYFLQYFPGSMPRADYRRCRRCGREKSEGGELSHTRLCQVCIEATLRENIEGIVAKSGPAYRRWRRGMVAYVVDQLLDEPASGVHHPD